MYHIYTSRVVDLTHSLSHQSYVVHVLFFLNFIKKVSLFSYSVDVVASQADSLHKNLVFEGQCYKTLQTHNLQLQW